MKRWISFSFEKWWRIPILSLALIGLSFLWDSMVFVIVAIVLVTTAVVFQFIKKGWKTGCLTGLAMLVIIALSAVWLFFQLFLSPPKKYVERYENRAEIQRIIGVEIPDFSVLESDLTHLTDFDFEFEVQATVEFTELPNSKIFDILDSIIKLPVPDRIDPSSSFYFYRGNDIYPCWSKDGSRYFYKRSGDTGDQFLHSMDAYFKFEMYKGSETAKMVYGNY